MSASALRDGLVALAGRGPVHFMGVGGAGMCALAELVLRRGGRVTGCDLKASEATRRLEALGGEVHVGHDPVHVDGTAALVVTSAVPDDHPELVRAREAGIPVLKRAEALGEVVNRGRVVAIAGTHGKTSTTAMATAVLEAAGMDPTGLVGGSVPGWKGNLRMGGPDLYVVEADEYDRSFLTLEPDVAVVTNLEADHLDVYGDLEGVREGFRRFLAGLRAGGRVAVCADDPGASALLTAVQGQGYTYGLSAGAQLRAVEVETTVEGTRCRIVEEGEDRGTLLVRVPGLHNLRNGLAAAFCGRHLGAGWDAIRAGLEDFRGVSRRFETVGEAAGVVVMDDYAHHPTEIRATLRAVRATHPDRRLVVLFQPHLYTRTRDFSEHFGEALARADRVWLTDVFPAREEPIEGVDGALVVDAVRRAAPGGVKVVYHPEMEGLAEALVDDLEAGDVVIAMGAGSVDRVAPELLARLEGREAAGG